MRWFMPLALCLSVTAPSHAAQFTQKAQDDALLAYLRTYLSPEDGGYEDRTATATRLQIAWADLNGDGRPEAIVYVSGAEYCGNGGCTLLILERTAESFRLRGRTTITRLPIGVLRHRSSGWRDLTVFVAGGGILPGYRATLPFGGMRYASNPSVPPAHRLKAGAVEEILNSYDVYPYLH